MKSIALALAACACLYINAFAPRIGDQIFGMVWSVFLLSALILYEEKKP